MLKGAAARERAKKREADKRRHTIQTGVRELLRRIEADAAQHGYDARRALLDWFDDLARTYSDGSVDGSVTKLLVDRQPTEAMWLAWTWAEARKALGDRAQDAQIDRLAYRMVSLAEDVARA